jgi:hypothetical protein
VNLVEEAIILEKSQDENYEADLNEFASHLQINIANGCHLGKMKTFNFTFFKISVQKICLSEKY